MKYYIKCYKESRIILELISWGVFLLLASESEVNIFGNPR